jgi:hypothetical protein
LREGAPRLSWAWRIVALIALAALLYFIWRGYQQAEFIFDFGNLRMC